MDIKQLNETLGNALGSSKLDTIVDGVVERVGDEYLSEGGDFNDFLSDTVSSLIDNPLELFEEIAAEHSDLYDKIVETVWAEIKERANIKLENFVKENNIGE